MWVFFIMYKNRLQMFNKRIQMDACHVKNWLLMHYDDFGISIDVRDINAPLVRLH